MSDTKDEEYLPYGRQWISEEDVSAVNDVLYSDWITTGPKVGEFEEAVAERCGVKHGVAVSNGTTALHTAYRAVGIGPGDEVIVPSITFAATANMVAMLGATPVFADVDAATLLIDEQSVRELVSDKTRAIVGVDFAGQPFDHEAMKNVARENGLALISDAAHSLGGSFEGEPVGQLADITTFSFHPVKQITTGEGGMVVTNDSVLAARAKSFRNHGIDTDFRQREGRGTFEYDVTSLGTNYRMTDIQCALGISQLSKLEKWVEMRNNIADNYDQMIDSIPGVTPLARRKGAVSAFHLYVVRINKSIYGEGRNEVFKRLRERNIGVNVHYRPVHTFSYYNRNPGPNNTICPEAEKAYEEVLSLPIFPKMDSDDVSRVIEALNER